MGGHRVDAQELLGVQNLSLLTSSLRLERFLRVEQSKPTFPLTSALLVSVSTPCADLICAGCVVPCNDSRLNPAQSFLKLGNVNPLRISHFSDEHTLF